MKNLISIISGLLFGVGLAVSGMTNPQKVKGFLDIFGDWDISLIFVLLSAVGFNIVSFRFIQGKGPLFTENLHLPSKKSIDRNLIFGAVLFGCGWGISGFCPGPAIVNLVVFEPSNYIFLISMFIGFAFYSFIEKKIILNSKTNN